MLISDENDDDWLGELSFVEGDRPGSNLTYCEAYGPESIAAIQHRLNELKTGMQADYYKIASLTLMVMAIAVKLFTSNIQGLFN